MTSAVMWTNWIEAVSSAVAGIGAVGAAVGAWVGLIKVRNSVEQSSETLESNVRSQAGLEQNIIVPTEAGTGMKYRITDVHVPSSGAIATSPEYQDLRGEHIIHVFGVPDKNRPDIIRVLLEKDADITFPQYLMSQEQLDFIQQAKDQAAGR